MEENKELFTAENKADDNPAEIKLDNNPITETAVPEAPTEAESVDDFAAEEAVAPEAPSEPETEDGFAAGEAVAEEAAPKKSRKIQTTIIISAVIVLLVVLGAVAVRLFATPGLLDTGFFGNSKTTVWHFRPDVSQAEATVDEALVPDYYFIFESDNTLKVEMGSFEYKGSYAIQNMEESDLVGVTNENAKVGTQMLTIENTSLIDGKYLFERTGNAFTENKLNLTGLNLTGTNTQEMKLELDAKAYTPVSIERTDEFTKDDALLGDWVYKNENGSQTFSFKDDGTYSIITKSNGSYQSQSGIYNCKDGSVTIKFKAPSDQEANLKYTINDKTLSLSVVADVMGQKIEQPIGEFTKEEA